MVIESDVHHGMASMKTNIKKGDDEQKMQVIA